MDIFKRRQDAFDLRAKWCDLELAVNDFAVLMTDYKLMQK
jgi:hypothetical protein